MIIKIGIVEDTLEYIETFRILLAAQPVSHQIVQTASDLATTHALLKNTEIDLAFLDIQLQEGTVFEVLDQLVKEGNELPEIVFVTAHGNYEYATKAIRFACLDFITKPISEKALGNVLLRFQKKQQKRLMNEQVAFLLNLLKGNMNAPTSIGVILPKGVIEFLDLEEIFYLKGEANICKIHLQTGKVLTSTRHLGYYIDLLTGNADFIQISKNCLLNTSFIRQYDHRHKSILLKNGEQLLASHRFSKHLKKVLLSKEESSIWKKISHLFR